MGVFRNHKKDSCYSSIHNAGAEDTSLSWAARGVLWYLLTKPDKWETRMQDLINHSPAKRDANQRIMKELEQAGYIIRWCSTGEGGQLSWASEVFECVEYAEEWRRENAAKLAKAVNTKSRKKPKTQANPTTVDEFTATGFYVSGSTVDGRSDDLDPNSTATGFSVNGSTVDGEPGCLVITELVNTDQDLRSIDRSDRNFSDSLTPDTNEPEPEAVDPPPVATKTRKASSVKPIHTQDDPTPAENLPTKKKKYKETEIPDEIWERFRCLYMALKCLRWSDCESMFSQRRKAVLSVINDYGDIDRALTAFEHAIRNMAFTDWFQDRDMDFDNLLTKGKIPKHAEAYGRLQRLRATGQKLPATYRLDPKYQQLESSVPSAVREGRLAALRQVTAQMEAQAAS